MREDSRFSKTKADPRIKLKIMTRFRRSTKDVLAQRKAHCLEFAVADDCVTEIHTRHQAASFAPKKDFGILLNLYLFCPYRWQRSGLTRAWRRDQVRERCDNGVGAPDNRIVIGSRALS